MLQAFYTGLSGMVSFQKNLDTVSNNIANMNTPGYRGSESFYKSLSFGNGENGGQSYGTQISGLGYRFAAGDIRQTGNATDLAIAGNGFFTLMQDGELFFTRAGQFSFNENGVLVDKTSGASVAAFDEQGKLVELDISQQRVLQPEATSKIDFTGNLSSDQASHNIAGVKVFNSLGEEIEVTVSFTKHDTQAGGWNVTITDADNKELGKGEIRFSADGAPTDGFSKLSFSVSDSRGGSNSIELNFGSGFGMATSVSTGTTSTIRADVKDGSAISELQRLSFDSTGTLVLNYSNGEERKHNTLALSDFSNKEALTLVEGSLFKAQSDDGRTTAKAGEAGIGSVAAESLELSNVDLSKEFADMIIIQRGYQASSRMLNVANQMLEQLYESTRGR